jgi:hypothetical protein
LLNSHHDLGINSPASSRFLYRTVNSCASIRTKGYTRWNTTTTSKKIQFLYGDDPGFNGEDEGYTEQFDITGVGNGTGKTACNGYDIS